MKKPYLLIITAILYLVLTGGSTYGDNPYTDPKGFIDKNKIKMDFLTIQKAAQLYEISEGSFPPDIDTLVSNGYLDKRSSLDPWGNSYEIEIDGEQIIVTTYGADGKEGGAGRDADISSND
jgi:competence protein ComGC